MDTDLIRNSVTANDYELGRRSSLSWLLTMSGMGRTGLPAYWTPTRDYYLRSALYADYHDFWAGAIGIAITKMASLDWLIEGTQPRIRNYFQQMYLDIDGAQSWVSFLSRHLQDFLSTDNGAFIEIVRSSNAAGSRILGLMHLDSIRCTRTGDPAIPIIYRDLVGQEHQVEAHQVMLFSDMPASAASLHGVGFCAASRAWTAIRKMETIERYIYEKISGDRALALDIVKGIAPHHLKSSIESAREDREQRLSNRAGQTGDASPGSAFAYLGSVVVPVFDDTKLEHVRINFAELPDGFDRQKEFDIAVLQMANAIGLDVQDLQPLTGRPLGTAMQSQVLEEKSKGKGLAAWRKQFPHQNNQLVLPDTVTFAFSEKDLRDKQAQAEVFNTEATAVKTAIEAGTITPAQGTQILADGEFIPREFVPEDVTPQEAITDTEKPRAEAEAQTETLQEITIKEGFDESLHPRDDEGKFTGSGGGSSGGGKGNSNNGVKSVKLKTTGIKKPPRKDDYSFYSKQVIANNLSDSEWEAYTRASGAWYGNTQRYEAILYEHAASKIWGGDVFAYGEKVSDDKANRYYDEKMSKANVTKAAQVQYATTQHVLKSKGKSEVILYRGIKNRDKKLGLGKETIEADALSSWTDDIETASEFAKGENGRVLTARFSASDIFSYYESNTNASYSENEWVVLGRGRKIDVHSTIPETTREE